VTKTTPLQVYHRLHQHYGAQDWWPADTPFEMMVGAILTQNTSWQQVETAIAQLKSADCLSPAAIEACDLQLLETLIRPSGFFRQKSTRLVALARFYHTHGGIAGLRDMPPEKLRLRLLSVHGIGAETADSILLYAIHQPFFVVDTYTRRLCHRLGFFAESIHDYTTIQQWFHGRLTASTEFFQEYHALIVVHAKQHCLKNPRCIECPLCACCAFPC